MSRIEVLLQYTERTVRFYMLLEGTKVYVHEATMLYADFRYIQVHHAIAINKAIDLYGVLRAS